MTTEQPKAQPLCRLDDIVDGGIRIVSGSGEASVFSMVVLRSGDCVHAFANRCPHFGVPLAQREEHLIYTPHRSLSCNNHYARFRWTDGYCEFGDCAGESLQAISVSVVDGEVRLVTPQGE